MKKSKLILVSCIAIASSYYQLVEAGTTRSGGGHGMINARNFVATRSVGAHNFGGHFAGQSRIQVRSNLKKLMHAFKGYSS